MYLPSELIVEVLARLPVKPLLRFRCVSKTWRDLIANPYLISLHLNHNINNIDHNFRIVTVEKTNDNEIGLKIRLLGKFKESAQLMNLPPSYRPIVSNDGLILMLDNSTNELILVNPSAKKSLQLPTCPIPYRKCVIYAIGYASTINDFKVVAYHQYRLGSDHIPSFAVYSLRDGCWRTKSMNFLNLNKSNVLFTKGAAHWLSRRDKVVSFEFDVERFSFAGSPDYEDRDISCYLFSLGGSVAIFGLSNSTANIWMMDKDDDDDDGDKAWTQLYSGDSDLLEHPIFYFYGYWEKPRWFVKKNGKFYVQEDGTLWSFDIRSRGDELEDVGDSFHQVSHADTYVECLLLC